MQTININPWIQIWIHPKKTMRAILDHNPKRMILWLAILGGISSTFAWLVYLWVYPGQKELLTPGFLTLILLCGAVFGFFYLYIGGLLYQLAGSWIGGKGNFTEVKCAVGWSNYPFIIANIASFFSLLFTQIPFLSGIFGFINAVIAIWGLVIFLNLLGEAHRFSAWRALLACIITYVLIFIAILIVSFLVPLFQ